MKPTKLALIALALCVAFTGCSQAQSPAPDNAPTVQEEITKEIPSDGVYIKLSDQEITVDQEPISTDSTEDVYAANDIIFYLENQGFTYGAGTEKDAHSQAEADKHTVVHITKPGTYVLSGQLSYGQIAIDLGEDAKKDPSAVVNLVLDGLDITCTVAPAVIFYNVYECGTKDEETATMDVDTSAAGANVILADGSENTVVGAYVARIYKSVELNEEGTEVISNKKLHKYDGAFYSKMSMNIYGEYYADGALDIYAQNEGLDSELHLTLFSGNVRIISGNDGINTNEDNISVTRIKGGSLDIVVTGSTGEGDGIDSNGWLIIEGGKVTASACGFSGDAGIDADKGVYLQGGQVIASGNMFDRVMGNSTYAVFTFQTSQQGNNTYTLKDAEGNEVITCTPANDFRYLIVSSPELTPGDYTLWLWDTQLSGSKGMGQMGFPGGQRPENPGDGFHQKPERPDGAPEGGFPDGMTPPEKPEGGFPEGMEKPEGGFPQGDFPQMGGQGVTGEATTVFPIVKGGNPFQVITQ